MSRSRYSVQVNALARPCALAPVQPVHQAAAFAGPVAGQPGGGRCPVPPPRTTGVIPRSAQVPGRGGPSGWPDSSLKTIHPPRAAAVLLPAAGLFFPHFNRAVVLFDGPVRAGLARAAMGRGIRWSYVPAPAEGGTLCATVPAPRPRCWVGFRNPGPTTRACAPPSARCGPRAACCWACSMMTRPGRRRCTAFRW